MITGEIVLTLVRIEVPAPRRGRPGYRWANGYVVNSEYPPILRREAYARAREIGGLKVKIRTE